MPDRLVIFHYHFLTGGVSSVVLQAVESFRACLPQIDDILLVGGRFSRTMQELPGIRTRAFPAVDYYAPRRLTAGRVAAEADSLAGELLREYGGKDRIWWVHNHHLGKNPVFTEALLRALRSDPDQRVLLQIHDFPECGRLANLRLLRRTLGSSPYPAAAQVRYAVLSGRDREVLLEAGLPAGSVHVLENPVGRLAAPLPDRQASRRALMRAFPAQAADLDPSRRLLLYPVRTIRRKNVLEAMLLARLIEGQPALLLTLPGVSRAERRYSNRVARGFAEGLCRGLWGAGPERSGVPFAELAGAADLVLSTSVQEGFGYLFVNALQWGRPLAGRRLENLECLRPLLRGYPAHLYDALRVPLRRSEAAHLRQAYAGKLRGLRSLYDEGALERLSREVSAALREERVDFSYLAVPQQLRMLRLLARGERLGAARQANAGLLEALQVLVGAHPRPLAEEVESRFGQAAFGRSFGRIIASFGQRARPGPDPRVEGGVQERILRRFARLEHLRLLYDF